MSAVPPPPEHDRASPAPFVGMIGMACVLFLIGASVLAAPWWLVAVLVVVWLLAMVVATAWWTLHPRWVPWIPVVVALVWFGSVVGGASLR